LGRATCKSLESTGIVSASAAFTAFRQADFD
jgi:hypothetical protein